MKICYLADANSTHTKKWCGFFKNKGYDIHVISLNDGTIDGVTMYSLKKDLDDIREGSSLKKISYVKYFGEIKRLIKKIEPDVVHAHYATSYGLLGALSGFHPYIISVWGSDVYDFPKGSFVKRKILQYNLSKADIIMSTSKAMAKETSQYTNKNIEITPFGVDLNLFKRYNEFQKNNSNNIIIGTVKSLEDIYGIDYLIRAFSRIEKKYDNIKLEIAGDGSRKDYLMNLCKQLGIMESIKFHGAIPQEEVVKVLNKYDIAVFPSLSESFGVAAVEAQACGIPVVVSNVGGLPEAISPGNSGILVQKENIDELEEALGKLISNSNLRSKMGNYARKFVQDNFNVEDNFNKVDNIYKSIIK